MTERALRPLLAGPRRGSAFRLPVSITSSPVASCASSTASPNRTPTRGALAAGRVDAVGQVVDARTRRDARSPMTRSQETQLDEVLVDLQDGARAEGLEPAAGARGPVGVLEQAQASSTGSACSSTSWTSGPVAPSRLRASREQSRNLPRSGRSCGRRCAARRALEGQLAVERRLDAGESTGEVAPPRSRSLRWTSRAASSSSAASQPAEGDESERRRLDVDHDAVELVGAGSRRPRPAAGRCGRGRPRRAA